MWHGIKLNDVYDLFVVIVCAYIVSKYLTSILNWIDAKTAQVQEITKAQKIANTFEEARMRKQEIDAHKKYLEEHTDSN